MEIKTVSIIGLGALGILYASKLSHKMPFENLRIVADKNRIEKYKKDGVYCNGKRYDFNYISSDVPCEPADLLIFTVKYQGLQSAIEAVKNHVGENTIVISALNGITSEEIIAKMYGADRLLYCVAQGMDAVKVNNQLTYHNEGMLCFGEKISGIISPKVRALEQFFIKTNIAHKVETDMLKRQWGKFMLNVGVNQTVAVVEGDYSSIQTQGKARDIMISAMREVLTLSQLEGINLTESDLSYWLDVLKPLNPKGKPSMRQDMEAKRYSEVELFSGAVLSIGAKHNVETPTNKMLYEKVKEIESKY